MSSGDQEFRSGDKVRITLEGVVSWDSSLRCYQTVRSDNYKWQVPLSAVVEAELIEPAYTPGEVYQSPGGKKWLRLKGPGNCWRPLEGPAIDVGHDYPARPLVRLVPES